MKNLNCSDIKNLQLWGWESYMKTRNSLVLQLLFLNFTELFQPSCLHILFAQLKRYLKFWKKTCITELNSIPTILRNSAPNSQYNSITFAEKCTDSEVAVKHRLFHDFPCIYREVTLQGWRYHSSFSFTRISH